MQPSRRRCVRRAGLTITEVLVAIGILGLLAALSIPAVQTSRAASRRVQCQSRLKQLGLAMSNIVDAAGAFPTSNQPHPPLWRILPYLDRAPLAEMLIANSHVHGGGDRSMFDVSDLVCPSETLARSDTGQTNYFLNDGTRFRSRDPFNGFKIDHKQDVRPADITDGLSQTAAMSERLVGNIRYDWPSNEQMMREPLRYFFWTEKRYKNPDEEPLAAEQCRNHRIAASPQTLQMNTEDFKYSVGGYDHMQPPNQAACYNGPEDLEIDTSLRLVPASSLHPGGVNVLMADGSVHFVSGGVDAVVWNAAGTRSGNESSSLPF
ncbi:MAG: DUF1559 domain-containing protein [Planctomyces sp.]|nr:DUF1559 domain-containing protein [Planctomyces sp.]